MSDDDNLLKQLSPLPQKDKMIFIQAKPIKPELRANSGSNFARAPAKKFVDNGNPYKSSLDYQKDTGMCFFYTATETKAKESNYAVNSKTRIKSDDEKICGKFLVKDNALYLISGDAFEAPIEICNFVIELVAIRKYRQRDGTEIEEIVYRVPGHEKCVISKKDYIDVTDEILKNYPECCISPEAYHKAKPYIREFNAEIYRRAICNLEVQIFYSYHGWERVNGKMVYLSKARSDCDCECLVPKIPVENVRDIWLYGFRITNIGSKIFLANDMIDVLASLAVSLPFFLYLHIGFACKLFEDAGMCVQFLLLIVGESGSLKTTICKTFAEPFNMGGMLRLESTPRALELYREESMDMTMLADDIFNKRKDFVKGFEEILRAFGDTVGRAKSGGTEFNTIRRSKVRGGCIVTAEQNLDSQQSSALRYITLSVGKNSIDTDVLRGFQEEQTRAIQNGNFSGIQAYFAAWIGFLEENYEQIVNALMLFQAPEFTLKFKRQQQSYKVFCSIAYMILSWGLRINAINQEQFDENYKLWTTVIQKLMLENQDLATIVEPWQQFLTMLHYCIAIGELHLARDKSEFERAIGTYIGYKRMENNDEQIVFSPNKIFTTIKHKIQESGKTFITDSTHIFRELFEREISYGYQNQNDRNGSRNRYLKRIKVNGRQIEMLIISVHKLDKVIEEISRGG